MVNPSYHRPPKPPPQARETVNCDTKTVNHNNDCVDPKEIGKNPIYNLTNSESKNRVGKKQVIYKRVRRFKRSKKHGPPYDTLRTDEYNRKVADLGGKA